MKQEPVAVRTHYPSGWEYTDGNPPFELQPNQQFLYTEPQYRELSDEEMNRVISKWMSESTNYLDLCKAILKKASEK